MKASYIYSIIFHIIVVSCLGCEFKKYSKSQSDNLIKVDKSFSKKSVEEGAPEAFKHYLLDDALQFTMGSPAPIRGLSAIYEGLTKGMDSTIVLRWDPQHAEVAAAGDLGYTWGYYSITKKVVGDSVINLENGKYVNIWKKDAFGNWKVKIDIGTSNY